MNPATLRKEKNMQTAENTLQVANTIKDQIGSRALFMMGAQNLTGSHNALSFKIRGSKLATHIRVTLDASDTYTVEFLKIRGTNIQKPATVCGVYAESLKLTIETHTGLALSL